MTTATTAQPELLLALQRGLPFVARPFAAVGEQVGASESSVLACVTALLKCGTARRFGAVFDSHSLGYDSTLCAADVPQKSLPAVTARLTPHSGVTHCYERGGRPNLWFTLTAPQAGFAAARQTIAVALRPYELVDLPAWRTFKIEAVFDTRLVGDGKAGPPPARYRAKRQFLPETLNERERAIVRRLQDSIPIVAEPFAALGEELRWMPDDLLARLSQWHQSGILRRIGLIVRHRELGFTANAMCVWAADPLRTADAGRVLAGFPEVTHCYERRPHPLFPFNLFAMIHAGRTEDVHRIRERMTEGAGLTGGLLLMSTREFKKSSPRFFEEP